MSMSEFDTKNINGPEDGSLSHSCQIVVYIISHLGIIKILEALSAVLYQMSRTYSDNRLPVGISCSYLFPAQLFVVNQSLFLKMNSACGINGISFRKSLLQFNINKAQNRKTYFFGLYQKCVYVNTNHAKRILVKKKHKQVCKRSVSPGMFIKDSGYVMTFYKTCGTKVNGTAPTSIKRFGRAVRCC